MCPRNQPNPLFLRNGLPVFVVFSLLLHHGAATAQAPNWQQRIKYTMRVDVDEVANRITGTQQITYTNNSPDTLRRIFMHLYWNAFRPGTAMDEHSRGTEKLVVGRTAKGEDVVDYDRRFQMRIADMTPAEQGWCHVTDVRVGGKPLAFTEYESILEIKLDKPLLPKQTLAFATSFNAQVPKMCRRSGRDSKQNIRYSIAQWYPKVAEYDAQGWNADDYVAREFYGVWGDYDVSITINKDYKLGGTGLLQNAAAIGWGYDKPDTELKPIATAKRTWRFVGNNIHDFAWAADPDYKHIVKSVSGNRQLHIIFKSNADKWSAIADSAAMVMPFLEKTYGAYAYPQYSFIEAGGGATEYPMCTLMNTASYGTAVHEWCHSWYQMMLGTNENLYGWMDEGFTSYAEDRALAWVRKRSENPYADAFRSYASLANSKFNEPMSTHANFFATNYAYNQNSYNKGEVFLAQLGYIIGQQALDATLLAYYRQWAFRHPTPVDFVRVAEKQSGMQLMWYKNYFTETIKTIDYGIDSIWGTGSTSYVRIKRIGEMPMPLDVEVALKKAPAQMHHVPTTLTFGQKPWPDSLSVKRYAPQRWTNTTVVVSIDAKLADLQSITIDPMGLMADVDRKNNRVEIRF
jgi:hypothetical protein